MGLHPLSTVNDPDIEVAQQGSAADPRSISFPNQLVGASEDVFEAYRVVDSILHDCEQIGISLRRTIASWPLVGTRTERFLNGDENSFGTHFLAINTEPIPDDFITASPASLTTGTVLRDFQLIGINWLNLLYRRNISCMLADEMGMAIQFFLCL
jgi:SWI/SNF-related matrix-associated actin-dependent regulator 1 of chromatin subfamily A